MSSGHEQQRVGPYRAEQAGSVEGSVEARGPASSGASPYGADRGNRWGRLPTWGMAAWMGVLAVAPACAEPTRSQSADPSRALTPVPACVRRMPPRRDADRGFMPQLAEKDYWTLVFPEASRSEVPGDGRTCSGAQLFTAAVFEGTQPAAGGSSEAVVIPPDGILFGGGGNRLRVVWLKSHQAEDGTAAGALALVRALDDVAEAYAVGVYRGDAERTRLQVERMGGGLAVTAVDERCAGEKPSEPCESLMHVFLPYRGELVPFAELGLRRVRFGENTEPGIPGRVRYELVTAPTFEDGAIRLVEQVSATHETGKKLRRAEVERVLVARDGRAEATSEPLWDRMVVSRLDGKSKGASDQPRKGGTQPQPGSSGGTTTPSL